MTAADDREQDRRRLEEIREELSVASLPNLGFDWTHLDYRDGLEREAAEIRARLGVEDERPPLPASSSWWGWALLVLGAVAVLVFIAVAAGV